MDYTPGITIDSIKWERVILNIAGRIKNIDETAVSFTLTSGDVSLPLKSMQIVDGFYLLRVNVSTVNTDCTYLSDGEWTLTAQDNVTGVTYMPKISDELFCDNGIEDEYVYCHDKSIKIQRFHKKFSKSAKHYYEVNPTLNEKGGMTLNVFYQHPNKKNPVIKFIKNFIKNYCFLLNNCNGVFFKRT